MIPGDDAWTGHGTHGPNPSSPVSRIPSQSRSSETPESEKVFGPTATENRFRSKVNASIG